jgi:hypothetical protein
VTCGTDDPARTLHNERSRFGTIAGARPLGAFGRMSTHTFDIDADRKRLDIARRVYKALVAQDPDRLIVLCDANGRALARNERRSNEDAVEKAS